MNEKSYVSLERHVCVVCCVPYETGALLIDRRLLESLEKYTTTGWGLCPEHLKLYEDGYVALVECGNGKPSIGDRLKPEDALRTGDFAHLKRDAFAVAFNVAVEPDIPVVFVEPGVLWKLRTAAGE